MRGMGPALIPFLSLWWLQHRSCLCCRGIVRRGSSVTQQLGAQAEAPSAVAAALHDVEECLVANLVEIQRAAADGAALAPLQKLFS